MNPKRNNKGFSVCAWRPACCDWRVGRLGVLTGAAGQGGQEAMFLSTEDRIQATNITRDKKGRLVIPEAISIISI